MKLQSNHSWQTITLSILIFFSFQPFYIWHTGILGILPIVTTFLILINKRMTSKKNINFFVVLFILYLYVGIRGNYTIIGIIVILSMLPLVLLKNFFFKEIFENFFRIFSILIGISLVVYILVMFLGINLPHSSIPPLNPLKAEFTEYDKYPFLVMCRSYGIYQPRFEGYFDEPGVIGTISATLLATKRFDLKDKYSWPILLAGLLSLSLFFYVIMLIYIILYGSWKSRLSLLLISSILFVILYNNEIVNSLLFSRFELKDGGLSGDNRKLGLSESWYKSFTASSSYWFGLGNQSHIKYNSGGASYTDLIIDYGFIFLFIYCVSFLVDAYINIKNLKLFTLFGVLFAGLLYQRPFITEMCYFYLLILPIFILRGIDNDKKNIDKFRKYNIFCG